MTASSRTCRSCDVQMDYETYRSLDGHCEDCWAEVDDATAAE